MYREGVRYVLLTPISLLYPLRNPSLPPLSRYIITLPLLTRKFGTSEVRILNHPSPNPEATLTTYLKAQAQGPWLPLLTGQSLDPGLGPRAPCFLLLSQVSAK
jgi:hypothetical protein